MQTAQAKQILGYRIVDKQTGQQVGKPYSYEQRKRCWHRVDKLDNQYGAYRYRAEPIYEAK